MPLSLGGKMKKGSLDDLLGAAGRHVLSEEHLRCLGYRDLDRRRRAHVTVDGAGQNSTK